jgi:hypothetical protein
MTAAQSPALSLPTERALFVRPLNLARTMLVERSAKMTCERRAG